MYKAFFSQSDLLGFALFALVFFVVFFAAVVLHAMRRPARSVDEVAALPLHDETPSPSAMDAARSDRHV